MPAKKLSLAEAVKTSDYVILDTNIIIREFKDSHGLLIPIPLAQRRISILTLYEFLHQKSGVPITAEERRERRKWLERNGITTLRPQSSLEKSFRSLVGKDFFQHGVVDCILAAECLSNERSVFMTGNVKHFERVNGLKLVPAPTL